jgi:CRP/FNR family transcriptional regulator
MTYEHINFFKDLSPEQRQLIEALFVYREYDAGTVLFEQGETANRLFIVLYGEVEIVYKPEDGPALTVTRVPSNNIVGWSAALGNPNYTSSAICSTDCAFLYVSGEDLRNLCVQYPDLCPIILDRLAVMIAKRLRNTHQHVIDLLKEGLQIQSDSLVQDQ